MNKRKKPKTHYLSNQDLPSKSRERETLCGRRLKSRSGKDHGLKTVHTRASCQTCINTNEANRTAYLKKHNIKFPRKRKTGKYLKRKRK